MEEADWPPTTPLHARIYTPHTHTNYTHTPHNYTHSQPHTHTNYKHTSDHTHTHHTQLHTHTTHIHTQTTHTHTTTHHTQQNTHHTYTHTTHIHHTHIHNYTHTPLPLLPEKVVSEQATVVDFMNLSNTRSHVIEAAKYLKKMFAFSPSTPPPKDRSAKQTQLQEGPGSSK